MIRSIGNITQEDLKSIGFKDSNKFIFPKMRKEPMSKVNMSLLRDLIANNGHFWTF